MVKLQKKRDVVVQDKLAAGVMLLMLLLMFIQLELA